MKHTKLVMTLLSTTALSACTLQPTPPPRPSYLSATPVYVNASSFTQPTTATPPALALNPADTQTPAPNRAKKSAPSKKTFSVWPQESYLAALNRWVKAEGFTQIAWQLPPDTMKALQALPTEKRRYSGPLRNVVASLASELSVPLTFSMQSFPKLAAFHPWDKDVTITTVQGQSLYEAVKRLTVDYGWVWIDNKEQGSSWRASNNYAFPAPYPIVTPKGDMALALSQVLAPFPVNAQLLDSTNTVFIVEEQ